MFYTIQPIIATFRRITTNWVIFHIWYIKWNSLKWCNSFANAVAIKMLKRVAIMRTQEPIVKLCTAKCIEIDEHGFQCFIIKNKKNLGSVFLKFNLKEKLRRFSIGFKSQKPTLHSSWSVLFVRNSLSLKCLLIIGF